MDETERKRMIDHRREMRLNDTEPCAVIFDPKDAALNMSPEDIERVMDLRQADPNYNGYDDYESKAVTKILDKYRSRL